jgi:hypothetical protein
MRLEDEHGNERLQLLDALVDRGERIRRIATLGEGELRAPLETSRSTRRLRRRAASRICRSTH